jgi:hypothetical protein
VQCIDTVPEKDSHWHSTKQKMNTGILLGESGKSRSTTAYALLRATFRDIPSGASKDNCSVYLRYTGKKIAPLLSQTYNSSMTI